ncbi:MAG: hypothetical protein U0893_24985 [Chloroflexota bacterium]
MKTKITRSLGALALATALFAGTTSAFAATPSTINPTVYDADSQEAGNTTATGLDLGGAGLGVGSGIVNLAGGDTPGGSATAAGLGIGSTVLTNVAAPIVRLGTR